MLTVSYREMDDPPRWQGVDSLTVPFVVGDMFCGATDLGAYARFRCFWKRHNHVSPVTGERMGATHNTAMRRGWERFFLLSIQLSDLRPILSIFTIRIEIPVPWTHKDSRYKRVSMMLQGAFADSSIPCRMLAL